MRNKKIAQQIEGFRKKRVLLIGDSILDIYVYGKAIGKSLETPTIVAREERTELSFGGAALVARNILELGGSVSFFSVVGGDDEARHYQDFRHGNLDKHFFTDKTRRTTVKKRFWVDGYKLLQMDNLDNRDIDGALLEKIKEGLAAEIGKCDAVVISDYRHGMLTAGLISYVKSIAKERKKNIFVDSQISHREGNHALYADCFMVLLSEKEAVSLDGKFAASGGPAAFKKISAILGKSNVCIKLGEAGSLCLVNGAAIRTGAIDAKAVDTCGAGDAFLAALCLSSMEDIENALEIANVWAGLSTLAQGANPPKIGDLTKYLGKE
ncbi:Bifunctional protein HldE [uncultured archaeon]|nr:Bifunctional protein HldE [uncultured archaeon]